MAECKDCDGIGTVECPHCIGNSFEFLSNNNYCPHCRGELFHPCSECNGTGEVEDKEND